MNKQSGFATLEVTFSIITLAVLLGWVLNIIQIFGTVAQPVTGEFIVRIAGIFIFPLGAVMGYL